MTDFLLALDCLPHDTIPFWELEFHLWDKFSGKPFYCGIDFTRLSAAQKEKALNTNAEVMVEAAQFLGFSALTVPGGYWELAPGMPAYYWLPEEFRFRQVEILKRMIPGNINLVANSGGVLAMPDAATYVDFSCLLLENPEEIDRLAKSTLKNGLENVKRFTGLGVEVLLTASDLADNSGPYFDPEQLDRFILPNLQKWSEEVKISGGKSILHTDGNISLYLEKLAGSGVNAIQSIDPVAGMNLFETLEKVQGEICLCGNLDCGLLLTGTTGQVNSEIKNLLQKAKNYNGFVFGASNAVQQEVKKENYLSVAKAVNDGCNKK